MRRVGMGGGRKAKMARAKKKLLPKDFEELLKEGDLPRLKAIFDSCELDARGGYSKRTALAFVACPDELARWLVEQGADIGAQDTYGETPLHTRAGHWQGEIGILLDLGAEVNARDSRGETPLHRAARVGNVSAVRLLLEHGALTDVVDSRQLTPLALALRDCHNARIETVVAVAELLLEPEAPKATGLRALASRIFGGGGGAGRVTPQMKAFVQQIGTEFEFHRANYNPEFLPAASAALERLYVLFDVPPVPRRSMHGGGAPIVAKAARWEDRHHELWALLVPGNGAAKTVQGEIIRISGRISNEIDGNGGVNWDANYKKMAAAFLSHLGSGVALPESDRRQAAQAVAEVRRRDGAADELCELAVRWVALNPEPLPLPPPDYAR